MREFWQWISWRPGVGDPTFIGWLTVLAYLVAAGLCTRCEVQLAYAIGVAKPVSIRVESFGTGVVADARLGEIVGKHFDARPGKLISELDLLKPIFCNTAAYGHFGREDEKGFTWERRDKVDLLKGEL